MININRLNSLPGDSKTYVGEIVDEFKTKDLPTELNLTLKVGAQVMFLKNGNSYFNGKIGKITSLEDDEIVVSVKDSSGQENLIQVEKASWENVEFIYNEETKHIDRRCKGKFIQYPLKLAWAVTIHKSQGLTFDKIAIDVVFRGDFFRPSGLVYVALSRCRTWKGVVLNRELNRDSIHVDTRVVEFARQTTISTRIDDAIKDGKADSFYRDARRKISEGKPELAFDSFLNAVKLRNDIETETFKRYIIAILSHLSSHKSLFSKLSDELANMNEINSEIEEEKLKCEERINELEDELQSIKSYLISLQAKSNNEEKIITTQKNEIERLRKLKWYQKF